MATALKIITRAFSKAGIRAAETPLSASELSDGLDVLNDMLSSWNANGVLTGVRLLNDINAETFIPRDAEWAVKANLAIILAGEYGVEISTAMAYDASNSLAEMTKARIDLSEINPPDILPRGSGNIQRDDSDFFPAYGADNF